MHSAFISTLALAFVIASAFGLDSSRSVEVFSLAILVALIGVPQGALDHVVGQRLPRPAFGSFWGVAFFSVYLAISVFVVIGWYVIPVATNCTFFLVSAWHFGLEERDVESSGWLRHLLAIASGGMIIWMPALFRGDEVAELLALITPSNQDTAIAFCVSSEASTALIFAPLSILDCIHQDLRHRREQSWIELNAYQGSAFSVAPKLTQSAYFRPHNRSDGIPGLYIAGAGTHPGAGVPGVINSAKATCNLIAQDYGVMFHA